MGYPSASQCVYTFVEEWFVSTTPMVLTDLTFYWFQKGIRADG